VSNMKATEISREVGGAFSLYGGYLTGRHVELMPNERIVQVWRAGGWDPGAHSIVRFELVKMDPVPEFALTIEAFRMSERSIWRTDGRGITGSRWRSIWKGRRNGTKS